MAISDNLVSVEMGKGQDLETQVLIPVLFLLERSTYLLRIIRTVKCNQTDLTPFSRDKSGSTIMVVL